jgi:aldose 1-epimerase
VRPVWWPAVAALVAATAGTNPDMPHATADAPEPRITVVPFGTLPDGRVARRFVLEAGGFRASVTDYGAMLTEMVVPPPAGAEGTGPVDVVAGFDDLAGYLAGHPYFGSTVGRCANRIAAGRFEFDGRSYQLAVNNGSNHLHGGLVGFDKQLWKAIPRQTDRGPAVEFELVSPDGDEGYPGRLTARVEYTLSPAGELIVEMAAVSDAPTIVNLAHHSYWNLAGHAAGSVADHELAVFADAYLPVDDSTIPTGEAAAVAGTPFDFRPERQPWGRVGEAIAAIPPEAAPGTPRGIDHNYLIRDWHPDGGLRTAAILRDPTSGRSLEILTDQPGIQVYMGNFLDGTLTGKGGARYGPNAAICLETQKFPDSVHHPEWPSVRLDPDDEYRHTMVHRFTR